MTYIRKPKVEYAGQRKNELGLNLRDYEGGLSTLCAGCGHDSITAAIVQAFFELNIPPYRAAKLSGIGCSSKTPAYFLSPSHGFNAVHGRMPAIATGASAVNPLLHYIGVSGDGDSLSIGLGQFAHAIRRNLNVVYIIENNGVYGLTKGQFSASADIGSKAKKGEENRQAPIDPVILALGMGASFVARGFSGDKGQLVPLLKAALGHKGFALLDIVSPCVTFNDHEGSTKSYAYTRENFQEATHMDFVPPAQTITVEQKSGEVVSVRLHDGSHILLRKVAEEYDPKDRGDAISYLQHHHEQGEVVTGLLYMDVSAKDMNAVMNLAETPLSQVAWKDLSPGSKILDEIFEANR
ncbi:MAG: 2-oxoacid:ferredoxin oxidoreductase subunit beta [Gammaproteobacteria bacterium]|nr:MAG: 2-oxoacid:ferredoxin oxidoreductase subunit beta [Gammaproteobacteria bacterium]